MLIRKNKPFHHIFTPLRDLLNDSRTTGVLLVGCTVISLIITNSSSTGWFNKFWNNAIPSGAFSALKLPGSPIEWINNFGMSFFFVLAATEIKRELLSGELSSFKKAVLPFGAAFGGMMVPALIFMAFNLTSHYSHGWGIPTATDIAFSLAAASLLGKRFPVGLKILLMAIAIIDDLGAIVVIALFYGGHIQWGYLLACGLIYGALLMCNRFKLKFGAIQIVLGILLWYAMLQSGIEASITGVLFAFAIPVKALATIEKAIHRYVNFFILPLFALANTAILVPAHIMESINTPVGMGIIFGLVVGKPLGIFLACRLMVGLNIASLPSTVKWKQVFGMGTLAGIGFTMSIFTTMLAFTETGIRDIAKISILFSVVSSVVVSYFYFRTIHVNAVSPVINTPDREVQLNLS
jgi:Na+:H+ antiporter, NhaA family